jgi:hypothetical protein
MFIKRGLPRNLAATLLVLLGWHIDATAAERQMQVAWSQLAKEVGGRKVSTVLTDGAKVQGRVLGVSPDGLMLNVTNSSDRTRFAGAANVPRSLITTVRVSKPGWKWRVIGPFVGALTLGLAGGAIGGRVNPTGGFGPVSDGAAKGSTVGVISGVGAGYIVGHFADRHTVLIEIVQ